MGWDLGRCPVCKMSTTVTMSLERFKELEAMEITLRGILGGKDWPVVVENMPYGTMVYAKKPEEIDAMLIEECRKRTEWGELMRQKAIEGRYK